MTKKRGIESSNGKERRAATDRRSTDRRDPERESGKGVLTTRKGERRQKTRRAKEEKTG
jgi:hypothetical protein